MFYLENPKNYCIFVIDMEIFRAIYDKRVWDDGRNYDSHIIHTEIGFYTSREKAERELYLYMTQRIVGLDKERTKKCISQTSKDNKIIINKDNYYWIEPVEVNE